MKLPGRSNRRSQVSDVAYIGLNVALVLLLLFAVLSTQTIWLALILVTLSKWRIFAVRPRFWRANILANLVDVVVGVSHVVLLGAAIGAPWLQVLLSVAYAVWILLIKPRSKQVYIAVQAGVAVFIGSTALATVAYGTDSIVLAAGMWVIGYISARHVLMSYDEPLTGLLSGVWGLVLAELGWLSYHWLFAYTLPNSANLKFVQIALVATLLSFLAEQTIASRYRNDGQAKLSELMLPAAFTTTLILVVVIFFSGLIAGSSL